MILGNTKVEKCDVKKDAWLCKGFCVLVKRNYSRGRLRSSFAKFEELLRLLGGESGDDDDGEGDGGDEDWFGVVVFVGPFLFQFGWHLLGDGAVLSKTRLISYMCFFTRM